MHFGHSPEIWRQYPELAPAVLFADGIHPQAMVAAPVAAFNAIAQARLEGDLDTGHFVVNGAKQVQSLKIDPEVVSKDDVEMLQDLILAAINDAHRKADEAMQQQMGGMMGGLKIPGMF